MLNLAAQTSPAIVFPYGTFAVDASLQNAYQEDYSSARNYPLPERLPHHHPLLTQLAGDYDLPYAFPLWWQDCLADLTPGKVRSLLETVSASEFRTGCIAQSRWKHFREALSPEERLDLPASPKIASLLDGTRWYLPFQLRGPAETPEQLTLRISTRPLDFLYMSNGSGWGSCQHFRTGSENHRLPSNFYDTGVAVAMVVPHGASVRATASVLARTTLRVFQVEGQTIVAIGRTYHNHETLFALLLRKLAALFDARMLTWGFLVEINSLHACEDGRLGPAFRQRLGDEVWADSEACWFPDTWQVPYVDGGEKEWTADWEREHEGYTSMQLSATVRLLSPRPSLLSPGALPSKLARLASPELPPCVC